MEQETDWGDELADWEYPNGQFDDVFDDDDFDDDCNDQPGFLPCPSCGQDVMEELMQCPYCGDYITFSTSPWSGRSAVWIILGALGTVAIICTMLAL